MEVLALITARGGSKGLPGKNIIDFLGRPLLAWSVDAAKQSAKITRIITSTDDDAIANVARSVGSEVPFKRPVDLAQDDTTDLPVFVHALKWLDENENYKPDLIIHLRPTSPLRPAGLIDSCIEKILNDKSADSLRVVCEPLNNPFKMWKITDKYLEVLVDAGIKEQYNQPRQKLPMVYWQIGTLDITKPATIIEKHSMSGERILPYIVNQELAVDIDNKVSLKSAEEAYKKYIMENK